MTAHAFLAPSSAYMWRWCALSATMIAMFPDSSDRDAAEKGEAAHWVGLELHHKRPVELGKPAPNGRIVDDDVMETGEFFASSLHNPDNFPWVLERRTHGTLIHETQNFGTPDAYKFSGHTLEITDWKGGHEWVDVYENWQLINYFALIWQQYADRHHDEAVTVRFRIVQPNAYGRDGPIRTWEVRAANLRGYVNMLRGAAAEATKPNPTATPGSHCKHCPGRNACQALERDAIGIAARARQPGVIDVVPLPAQARELAYAKESAAVLAAFISGREQELTMAIQQGQRVPGFALEHSAGREAWTEPFAAVKAVGDMLGVNVVKPALLTPTQARKAGLADAIVSGMAARPRGEAKLVRSNAERMAGMFGKSY